MIASLDVEEKTRAKDASEKGGESTSSANMTHTARTERQPRSLSRLLPSRRRRTQTLKVLASRAVKGDTSQEIDLTMQIARQRRVMDQKDPRMST